MNKQQKWKVRAVYWMLGGAQDIGTTMELADDSRRIIGGMIKNE